MLMIIVYIIAIPILIYFLIDIILSKFFRNPYKLYIHIGKKGSGKSTLLTKLAYKYAKKGKIVYCNTSLNLPNKLQSNIRYIGALDLWKADLKDCVVLLDETGIDFDCRDWANFPKEMKLFFVFQRKKKCTVHLFSQSLNVDKCIRDLADRLMICRCENGWLSVGRWIDRRIVFTKATDYGGSTIADELRPTLRFVFTFIPFWRKYFDTNCEVFVKSETIRKR